MKKLGVLLMLVGCGAFAQLYEIDYPKNEWKVARVVEGDKLYMRYRAEDDRWTWITGDDWRRILAGSVVKGWKINVSGKNANSYFLLTDDDELPWKITKVSERACIFRETGDRQCEIVKKEEPPPPPPTTKVTRPECTLIATPSTVSVGDSIVLEMVLNGQVDEASLDDEKIDLKVLKRIRSPRVPGKQTALAWVKGPAGASTCWTQYEVLPPKG